MREKTGTVVEGFRARVPPSTAAGGTSFRLHLVRSVRWIERLWIRIRYRHVQ